MTAKSEGKENSQAMLEPFREAVIEGKLDSRSALRLLAEAMGQFPDSVYGSEYNRFRQNGSELFEDEIFFDARYATQSAFGYAYSKASFGYSHLLFQLHEHLGGNGYSSPGDLKEAMQQLLAGRKVLELGCGPGFGVKVLQDLGAEVTGVELTDDHKGRIPGLDIRYDSATDLDNLCEGEEFDIIYSTDFFARANIEVEDANRIVRPMYERTAPGGYGFHLMNYERVDPIMIEFAKWLSVFQLGWDLKDWQFRRGNLNDEKREEELWTSTSSLDPQYLLRQGFNVLSYGIENADLVIVTQTPG